MLKIGNSNISIALTLIGIMPLIGGVLGLCKVISHYEAGINYSWLFQALFLTLFGLIFCGYRSCLVLYDAYGLIIRRIFNFPINKQEFRYDQFNKILIDIDRGLITKDSSREPYFYSLSLQGDLKTFYFDDFIRFNKFVKNRNSWELVKSMAGKIAGITGLKVCYSDKVKRYNSIEG